MTWPAIRVPLTAVQTAIYDRIVTANPTYSVFAYTPTLDPPFPFTVLRYMRGSNDDTKTSNGCQIVYSIEVHSQSTGTAELNGILNGILESISHPVLLVGDNWDVVDMEYTWSAVTEAGDEKGPIQHGVIELTIRLHDAS